RPIAGSKRVRAIEARRQAILNPPTPPFTPFDELRSLKFDFVGDMSTPPFARPFQEDSNAVIDFDSLIESGDPAWAELLRQAPAFVDN
ncbi:hypothetical protein HDZ31DRAFT_17316, partial [Schizophyllum fasciatum]